MSIGRIAIVLILLSAFAAGVGMFYLQVWGYYRTLPEQSTLRAGDADLAITGFQGIDSDSSPLRYRACFSLAAEVSLPDAPEAVPLNAPFWFDCFDATAIGTDLASGAARAVTLAADQPWGFDRIMALYPDGRAFVWPQINACGQAHFDGDPLPAGCQPPP